MPRRKRSISPVTCDLSEDDYDDDSSSNSGRHPPGQRNAANARERARMRILSSAFCRLKTKLPWVPPDTKLSKLDTLRLATTYIQQLGALLAGEAEKVDNSMPQNLTWPFHFQQPSEQKIIPQNTTLSASGSTSPQSSISSTTSSLNLTSLHLENQWINVSNSNNDNHPHHQHNLQSNQHGLNDCHFRETNHSIFNSILHGQ